MTCGMCARICWQCRNRLDRLKVERERQEERVVELEIGFAHATDDERDDVAERLQDAIEVWWQMGEEIDDLEGQSSR